MLNKNNNLLRLNYIPIICFLFLFIYTPVIILPFNVIHVLTIISIVFLICAYFKEFVSILKSPGLIVFTALNLFLAFYAISINILIKENIETLYSIASTIIEVLPCSIFISIVMLKRNINIKKFYDIILLIGMAQVICVVVTIVFPKLRELILLNSYSEGIRDTYEIWGMFRMYGLARGYTYSLPLFQGLCIIIAYVLGTYKSFKYYLLIPFYIISIAVNARIAFISLFIVPCVVFVFNLKKHPIKQTASVLIILFMVAFCGKYIQYKAENSLSYDTWVWLERGIASIINFNEGEVNQHLSPLIDSMWFMPKGIEEIIFGTGENVFTRSYMSSDIGYVVNLYYGGIIFSTILYISYFIFIIKSYGHSSVEKTICVSIIIYLFIANMKGNVFRPNEIINGVIIVIVYSIVSRISYQASLSNYLKTTELDSPPS